MPAKVIQDVSPKTRLPEQRKNENKSGDGNSALSAHMRAAIEDPYSVQPEEILALQRYYGNQAVLRLIQRKVTVGAADDPLEIEADRVADKVMAAPQPASAQRQDEEEEIQTKRAEIQRQGEEEEIQTRRMDVWRQGEEEEIQTKPILQRQEDEEEIQTKRLIQRQGEEEEIQAKPDLLRQEEEEEIQTQRLQRAPEKEEEIQTKPAEDGRGSFEAGADVVDQLRKQQGGGSPLPGEMRGFMEARFGADFSKVRVHADGAAARLNRKLSAQAFTHGQDIYLGEGKDNLASLDGQRLLAHELTHVVQQGGARRSVQRLVSRADFVRLAGEAGKVATRNKSTYWRILKGLDDHVKAAPKDKKMVLYNLGRDINTWLDKHREHKAVSEEPDAEIEENVKDKADLRKEEYLLKLREEVKGEYTGHPTGEETPSEIIAELKEKAQHGEDHLKSVKQGNLPKTDKYIFTVSAAIQNKDYLEFARKRLKVTIAQKLKLFNKLSNKQIKEEAARQVIMEKYKDLGDEERLQKIEELANAGGQVGHTWVIFKHLSNTGQKISEDSYGFWPLAGFNQPTLPVPGDIVSPDLQHADDPEQRRLDTQITPEQYVKGLEKAVATMKSPPEYKLIDYNCTKFARDVALTIGVSFPENAYLTVPMSSKAWNPNALYGEMEKIEGSYNPVEQEQKQAEKDEADREERLTRLRPQFTTFRLTVYSDDMSRKAMPFDGEDMFWYYSKNHKTDLFRVTSETDKEVNLIDQYGQFYVAPKDTYYTWFTKVTDLLKQIYGTI